MKLTLNIIIKVKIVIGQRYSYWKRNLDVVVIISHQFNTVSQSQFKILFSSDK